MTDTTDLFETLKYICGCEFVSDLRSEPYLPKARLLMQLIRLEPFSLFQLSDMAEYLFEQKISFAKKQEAADFFRSQKA